MDKSKYVRLIENVKRGYADKYDGIILSETKSELVLICQGPEPKDPIVKKTFSREEWIVEESTEDLVKHHFDLAMLNCDKEEIDAECDLMEKKHQKKTVEKHFKSVFGAT